MMLTVGFFVDYQVEKVLLLLTVSIVNGYWSLSNALLHLFFFSGLLKSTSLIEGKKFEEGQPNILRAE